MDNALTFDVEEWHDRTTFKRYVESEGVKVEGSAEAGVDVILKLLDQQGVKSTFFILGDFAEKHAGVVERIAAGGHEVGFHGFRHVELYGVDERVFRQELGEGVHLIKKSVGEKPIGFRAPRFSLTEETAWALDAIEKEGFRYDSSILPANFFYGFKGRIMKPYRVSMENPSVEDNSSPLLEFPLLARGFGPLRVPVKSRHMGSWFTADSIRALNRHEHPATVVFHSWEFIRRPIPLKDIRLPWATKLVHEYNIPCTSILESLLKRVRFTSLRNLLERLPQP